MEGRLEIWQIVYRNYFQVVFLLHDAFAGIFIYLSEELMHQSIPAVPIPPPGQPPGISFFLKKWQIPGGGDK